MRDEAKQDIPKKYLTVLINCMTHARRQFVDVVEAFPEECRNVIELLAQVYHHDDPVKEQSLAPEERMRFHQEESGPLLEELKA